MDPACPWSYSPGRRGPDVGGVSSPYRTLSRNELRVVLTEERFSTPAAGVESFELAVEAYPIRWVGGRAQLAPIEGPGGTRAALGQMAGGFPLMLPGELPGPGGGLYFGAGGTVGTAAVAPTPRAAVEMLDLMQDAVRNALGCVGADLVFAGHSPWHGLAELEASGCRLLEPRLSLDLLFGESGELGRSVLRSAGTQVRIGFGGAVHRWLRWRAAELVAPICAGLFANSPLTAGGHDGFKSERSRGRQAVDSSRTGWSWPMPGAAPEGPGDPVEAFLEYGLAARIVGVHHGEGQGGWVSPPRQLSFEQWMEHGIEGQYPNLDDWRAHLDTLEPEVAPNACIEFRGMDAVPEPFRAVPLLLLTGLLVEPGTAQAVVEHLEHTAPSWRTRWAEAARGGLLDPDLAEEGRWLWARAAEGLLRLPDGWFAPELLVSFLGYGRRFAQRGLTPADEVLDLFLERGTLGRAELDELNQRWRQSVGGAAHAA